MIVAQSSQQSTTIPLRRYHDHQDLTTTYHEHDSTATLLRLNFTTNAPRIFCACSKLLHEHHDNQELTTTTTLPRPYHDGPDRTTILNFCLFVVQSWPSVMGIADANFKYGMITYYQCVKFQQFLFISF